jgi:class 3 adenylate cyclase
MGPNNQFLSSILDIIDEAEKVFQSGASVQEVNEIPEPQKIPQRRNHWLKIRNIISLFVDMKGSTKLSAVKHDKSTAEIYQLFTDTMVRIVRTFGSSYVDIKGDGVFALFNGDLPHTALCAAVSCKTFAAENFRSKVRSKRGIDLDCHIGIDRKTVLVKRVGMEPRGGDDSHLRNEVWAGRPVNMSAKLSAYAGAGELLCSERFFRQLTHSKAKHSCGCGAAGGQSSPLWEERDVSEDDKFDFEKAYLLKSRWCPTHGRAYCKELLNTEKDLREHTVKSNAFEFLLYESM